MQRGSRNELLRLGGQPMDKLPVYYGVRDRGAVVLRDEELHAVRIVAEDDNGNISEVGFRVKRAGRTAQASVNEQTSVNAQAAGMQADGMQADGTPADCRRQFSYSMDGASVTIPAGALYESILYKQSSQEVAQPRMKHYSPVYTLHNDNVPLHQAITIAIDVADVPDAVKPKLCLARIAADGRYRYAAAKHEGGRVSGKVRAFGRYVVVADKTPPVIKPSFSEGADLTGAKSISLTLSDNFSGVPSFSATIDGQWIAFEQRGNTITHFFNPERISYNGAAHTLKITATDSKGNSATLTRKFVR